MVAAPEDDRTLTALLWASIGAALLTEADFFAARAGVLVGSPASLLIPGLAAVVLGAICLTALRAWDWRDRAGWALASILFVYVVALALLDLIPPIGRDELTYHLALPKLFLREGRVRESADILYSYFPLLLELQFMPLLAYAGAAAAKALHLLYGLAAAAVVFHMIARLANRRAAALGATLLFTTPAVAILASRAYVDLAVLFYGAVAFFALLRWQQSERLSWLVLAALASGCVVGVKYSGLLVVAFLTLGVALLAAPRGAGVALRQAVLFAVVAAVPALPWLAKNWAQTGNPVFPFFGEIFGGESFSDMARLDAIGRRHLQYGESWLEIALIPLRIFLTGAEGDIKRFDGVFNPIFLLGFAAVARRGAGRLERVFACVAAVLLPAVFFAHDFAARYLALILVPLAPLSIEGLTWLRERAGRNAVAALVAVAFAFNFAHFARYWRDVEPLALLTGARSQETFLNRWVPEYPVVQYANAHLDSTSRTYQLFLGDRSYYWDVPFTYDGIYYASGRRLRAALSGARDGCDVAGALHAQGITHIAASERLLLRFLRENLEPDEGRRWMDFQATYLRPLFRFGGYGLYQVGECAASP